ncbi:MAG: SDR family NAD(P)-dependent oxidoreductase [Methylobacteriaceae bacterium]|nr:SDR family NAD(P)-dependent oxidoreductase [Methylobacteriaceae bacterium]
MNERVALISGASRGIGASIAAELAGKGWTLSLGMRSPALPDWADPGRTQVEAYDALDPTAERRWIGAALERFGRIDAVVANAGVHSEKTILSAEDEDLDALTAVNVKAPRRLIKEAWNALEQSGRGRVIIIASLSGKRVASLESSLYALSKFAVVALSHGVRQAGWSKGIRCTAVCPGFVATDMTKSISKVPQAEMTPPGSVAKAVSMLLDLPNEASVAEFTINCRLEEIY